MEKSKHTLSSAAVQILWHVISGAGTKSACNGRPGHKEWENWELISERPVPTSPPKHTALYLFCYTSCTLRNSHTCRNSTHTLSFCYSRHFTAHNQAKQTWQSGNLRRSIIYINHVLNKHDIEGCFLNRNRIKGRQSNWIPYLVKEQNCFCSAVCSALSLLDETFRDIRSSHCQHLCFVEP